MINSHTWTSTLAFIVLMSLLTNASRIWSDEPDPTTPSPQIAERLAKDNRAPVPTNDMPNRLRPDRFRLKAIVFRSYDNATALISLDDSKTLVVRLRRRQLRSPSNRINIRGTHFSVNDFSESSITLTRLDTNQQFIIN